MTAYARAIYVSDGSSDPFTLPFKYLSRDHIQVRVDGAPAAFSWSGATAVTISPAPSVGAEVEVSRVTPRSERLVDFTDGSILTEAQLDTALLQQMYINQEVLDTVADTMTRQVGGQYDAKGYRLANLAEPSQAADAATKGYVDAIGGGAHADAARAWATTEEDVVVEAGEYSAKHHARKAALAAAGLLPASTTTSGTVELADISETRAGTDAVRAVTPATLADALAVSHPRRAIATVGGAVTLDLATADVFELATSASITLSGLSNATAGQIFVTRLAYGGAHTVSMNATAFRTGAAAPKLSAASSAIDLLAWIVAADGASAQLLGWNAGVGS